MYETLADVGCVLVCPQVIAGAKDATCISVQHEHIS